MSVFCGFHVIVLLKSCLPATLFFEPHRRTVTLELTWEGRRHVPPWAQWAPSPGPPRLGSGRRFSGSNMPGVEGKQERQML